jgi:hypothetical protein
MSKLFTPANIMIALGVVVLLNCVGYFVYHGVIAKKSDSYESHLVHNYLKANSLPDLYYDRFKKINANWPPSRSQFAELFFDANRYVSERENATK